MNSGHQLIALSGIRTTSDEALLTLARMTPVNYVGSRREEHTKRRGTAYEYATEI